MIDPAAVGEILAQYEKHGWVLRRALLSSEGKLRFAEILGEVEITIGDFDALWFSRKSKAESEAWELRRLTNLPFALVAVVPTDAGTEELESTLAQVAEEMRAKTIA